MSESQALYFLCNSADLVEGGSAIPFDVVDDGEACRAFAIRYDGLPQAYLNRCSHVPVELDLQPNRVFDDSGQWLVCASHGAVYQPDTGQCAGGPCRGGLVKIMLLERDSVIFWNSTDTLEPCVSPIPL